MKILSPEDDESSKDSIKHSSSHKKVRTGIDKIYHDYYKQLLIIPFVMLIAALVIIGITIATTGDFVSKGISLKGGTELTLTSDYLPDNFDPVDFEAKLKSELPNSDVSIRIQRELTEFKGVIVGVDLTTPEELETLKTAIINVIPTMNSEILGSNMNTTGSALGDAFFKQVAIAVVVAFLLMAIVVFWRFRVFVPSFAVVLAAFSDIVVTIAIIDLFGIKLSTAGVAAFLMLIGYSVDTDILLSTRVLKEKEGTVYERVVSAVKTGLTMNITTMAALVVGLFVARSEVITQIMLILLIGLCVDMINTWFQNAGILRMYAEKKLEKVEE